MMNKAENNITLLTDEWSSYYFPLKVTENMDTYTLRF
jgi:hypothetical protein